jgi:hypothetical protein
MSDQQPQYRPDTVVNGHVLIEDAQWVTVQGPVDPTPAERTRMSGVAKLGIILRFLWLVGCVAIVANFASEGDTTTSAPERPRRHRPEATCQCRRREEPGRSRRASAPDSSDDVALGRAMESPERFNMQYVPVTITNHSEKRSDYWMTSPPTARRLPNDHDTSDRYWFGAGTDHRAGRRVLRHRQAASRHRVKVLLVERTPSL